MANHLFGVTPLALVGRKGVRINATLHCCRSKVSGGCTALHSPTSSPAPAAAARRYLGWDFALRLVNVFWGRGGRGPLQHSIRPAVEALVQLQRQMVWPRKRAAPSAGLR
jgi:hypothetical protein